MPNTDHVLFLARNEIRNLYGHDVDVVSKAKHLRKFGKATIGTSSALIAQLPGDPGLETTNAITSVVSSDAADDQTVTIEYHTIDGDGNLTFGVQTATLNGQTPVLLSTPAARVSRLYNSDSTELAGAIAVYEGGAVTSGVPDDSDTVHLQLLAGQQQSYKLQTSTSQYDYWIITYASFSVLRAQTRAVDFEIQIRNQGGVWRPAGLFGGNSSGSSFVLANLDPPLIVRPNSDVRVMATSSGATTTVTGVLGGHFAIRLDRGNVIGG